ncbi:hypothetical protein SAMN05192586_109102 [Desulfovibrio legallii]|uniref:Uncharacterized protein n=1 Tax=Desulfovibrio legallii TaxID=571438 RepID=A0A1G7MRG8_9BACT|nr:hypothetical protein SAMN05192586_109102 [Desulfovibrio legallii]
MSMNHLAFRPRLPFSVGARSVYAPFRFQSQLLFFVPGEISFRPALPKTVFLKSRWGVMLPLAASVNRFFRNPQNFFCLGLRRSGSLRRKANVVRRPHSVKHFLLFSAKSRHVRAGRGPEHFIFEMLRLRAAPSALPRGSGEALLAPGAPYAQP